MIWNDSSRSANCFVWPDILLAAKLSPMAFRQPLAVRSDKQRLFEEYDDRGEHDDRYDDQDALESLVSRRYLVRA